MNCRQHRPCLSAIGAAIPDDEEPGAPGVNPDPAAPGDADRLADHSMIWDNAREDMILVV